MAIKIIAATDTGLGQRLPEVVANPVKKVLPKYVAPPLAPEPDPERISLVGKDHVAQEISRDVMGLGATGLGIALDNKANEERMSMITKIKEEHTLEKEAHSKAAVDFIGFKANISKKLNDIIDDKSLDSENKLIALKDVYMGAKSDFKDAVPPQYAADFAPHLEEHMTHEETRFLGHLKKQAEDKTIASTQQALATIEGAAANGSIKLNDAISQAAEWIKADPRDETHKVALAKTFVSQVYKNDVLYRRNAGDLNGLLHDLTAQDKEGNPTAYPGMDPTERQEHIATTLTHIKAAEAQDRAEIKSTLDVYKDLKLSGLPVSELETQLGRRVKGTIFEPVFNEIKTKGESAAHILKKTEEDPLGFGAARLGVVVKPLNIADPAGLQGQFAERVAIADKVKAISGLDYLPVLKGDEVKSLSAYMKNDLEGAGIKLMEGFSKMAGAGAVSGMARQIAREDKKVATVMQLVADGDNATAKDIAKGWGYMETKAATMPKEQDIKRGFDELIGKALDATPENRDTAYEAFKALYANQIAKDGKHDGVYDEKAAKESFKRIVGDVTRYNGRDVLLPKGFTEEDFLNSVRWLDAETVKAHGGVAGLSDVDAATRIKNEGQLYNVGGGYGVFVGGIPLYRPDGSPFRLMLPKHENSVGIKSNKYAAMVDIAEGGGVQ